MALLADSAVTAIYDSGSAVGERTVLYLVKNVDTADTYNVSAKFNEIKAATFVVSGVLNTVGTVSAAGTVLTFTLATMADDNIYLLVIGMST